MPDFDRMPIRDLICEKGFDCGCGKRHVCAMDYLAVGRGKIRETADMVRALGCEKPFVVCDQNTWEAAGKQADRVLTEAGMEHACYVIPCAGQKIAPAEWEVGSCLMHFDPACDLILGVGSGVINDICKVLGNATGRKSAIVGTAPSMDGYASNSSSMEINHVKMSLFNHAPKGILLDTDILAKAPMRMLWAGLGDMAAKYIAICEWRMSHLVTGEYYCEDVAKLMRSALKKVVDAADGIPNRDPAAIQAIAEGLVISGIGTVLTMKLYRKFRQITPDRAKAAAYWQGMTEEKWRAQIEKIFGKTAPEIIEMERKTGKNDPAAHEKRLENIIGHWDEIQRAVEEELPDYDALLALMEKTGMPTRPSQIGISLEDTVNAFIGARDARNKYMSCSLLWDLGLTEEFADYLRQVAEE